MKIDVSRIESIAGDDKDMIQQLFELFLDSYKNCLNRMKLAIAETDNSKRAADWHDACHEMKGSAYNLGFTDLGEFTSAAENITDTDNMQEAYEMFKFQLIEVESFIEQY